MTASQAPRLLFVSHHFPPDTSIGSKRSHRIAAQMRARGWEVHVLCAELLYQDGVDERLMKGLEGVQITRTHELNPRAWARWGRDRLGDLRDAARPADAAAGAPSVAAGATEKPAWHDLRMWLSDGVSNLLEFPDQWGGWLVPAVAAAQRLPRPDVVLATFPVATSVLVASAIAKRANVPLVLDYRDPWDAASRKTALPAARRRFEAELEALCHRQAAALVTVTPGLVEEIGAQAGRAVHLVSNACEPERLSGIQPRVFERPTLLYAGNLYGGRSVTPLLDAMARLRTRKVLAADALSLLLIGSGHQQVLADATARGVADMVDVSGPVPHHEALAASMGAAANILLVAPEHRLQVPAKVFEQLAVGRPILCLADPAADASRLLATSTGALCMAPEDATAIDAALVAIASGAVQGSDQIPQQFTVAETMDRLHRILRRAAGFDSGATRAPITLCATGDLMLPKRVVESLAKDPIAALGSAGEMLRDADIAFGNLETPIVTVAQPTPSDNPLQPVFVAPAPMAGALREAGFTLFNLANNHIRDAGAEGIQQTRQLCEDAGIQCAGAGTDLADARRPAIVGVGEQLVGLLAYTNDCTASANEAGTAPLHDDTVLEDVRRLRREVDYVVVSLHFGIEYAELPTAGFQRLCRKIARSGASLVLGHHPHVYQGHERVGDCWVIYSLGNCLADTIDPETKKLAFERTELVLSGARDLQPDDPRLEDVVVATVTLGEQPQLQLALHRLREDFCIHPADATEQHRFDEQLRDQLQALSNNDPRLQELEQLFMRNTVGAAMDPRNIARNLHRVRPHHARVAARWLRATLGGD